MSAFPGGFYPEGVVKGPDGLLYVTVSGDPASADPTVVKTGYVVRLDPATRAYKDTFIDNVDLDVAGTKLESPDGLVFGPDGRLYVASGVDVTANTWGRILIFDGQSGAYEDKIDLAQPGETKIYAQALLFGPQDRLYVPITWGEPETHTGICLVICEFTTPNLHEGEVRVYDTMTKSYTLLSSGGSSAHFHAPTYLSFATTDTATLAYRTPTTQSLTVNATGSGRVSSSPTGIDCGSACSYPFNQGMSVTLTATPDTGYSFSGWSGDCSGVGECRVSMTAATNVTATFTANIGTAVQLHVAKTGRGRVVSRPAGIQCGRDCSQSFMAPKTMKLLASAASGYRFTGWEGACQGNERTCTVVMSDNREVIAHFTPIFRLTVGKSGAGNVQSDPPGSIQCGKKCSASLLESTSITLKAVPKQGFRFAGWGGDCSGTDDCSLTMTRKTSVRATFRRLP